MSRLRVFIRAHDRWWPPVAWGVWPQRNRSGWYRLTSKPLYRWLLIGPIELRLDCWQSAADNDRVAAPSNREGTAP